MGTSIGQYGPVLIPGGALSLTEEPGRPQSTSLQRSGHDQSNPVHIDTRRFVPVAALPPWELSVKVAQLPGLQGQGQSPRQELWPYQSLFRRLFWRPLWPVFLRSSTHSGPERAPLPGVLLCCSTHQAHREAPLAGVLLRRSVCQALKGAPWVGSYSLVQCVRH